MKRTRKKKTTQKETHQKSVAKVTGQNGVTRRRIWSEAKTTNNNLRILSLHWPIVRLLGRLTTIFERKKKWIIVNSLPAFDDFWRILNWRQRDLWSSRATKIKQDRTESTNRFHSFFFCCCFRLVLISVAYQWNKKQIDQDKIDSHDVF